MSDRWSDWKSFPDAYHGEYIQAPIGPGVYEVCRRLDPRADRVRLHRQRGAGAVAIS